MEAEKLHFYKANVGYTIAVRANIGDSKGKVLTQSNPYVVIADKDLRDFKRANRTAIQNGLIVETTEPNWDDETPNALEDDKAAEIVKNVFALQKALKSFTAEVPLRKLLEAAEEQHRPKKTIDLIKKRLVEVTGIDEDEESPQDMQGEYNG